MADVALDRLRRGLAVGDAEFDRLYPTWAQRLSNVHWTPVDVARRAAQLLAGDGARVLDVGSGVGKLCLIGALTTRGVFYGVEQRHRCVQVATAAARRAGASRAHFIHGNMTSLDWRGYDAFYLYNPFVENLYGAGQKTDPIDDELERSPEVFTAYIQFVRERLSTTAIGSRVVTYHGFGGDMPSSFELVREEHHGTDALELWMRTRGGASG